MISTRKKKQHKKRLLSELSESDAAFMTAQNDHGAQSESRANTVGRDAFLNDTNNPTQADNPQVEMQTLEKIIVSKVRSEVDSVMTTVELRMKSVNASSGHEVGSVVLDPDQSDFSRNIEGLQMTASSRINSHTDLNKIDETRGNITVEGRNLFVNEKYIDRQAHTHHTSCQLFSQKL